MKRINVVYDEDFENAIILEVPDEVADAIEAVTQSFFDWIHKNPEQFHQTLPDGRTMIVAGADEFAWWINQYHATASKPAKVIMDCGKYNPQYPIAAF